MYKDISTKKQYNEIKKQLFIAMYPELNGNWKEDRETIKSTIIPDSRNKEADGNFKYIDSGLQFGSTQDRINHKVLEELVLAEVEANKTTQGLLDLISELDARLIALTDVAELLIKRVVTNNKGLELLTNIVSANEIGLNHIENDLYINKLFKFKKHRFSNFFKRLRKEDL